MIAGTHNAFGSLFARAGGEVRRRPRALQARAPPARIAAWASPPTHRHDGPDVATLLAREERYDEALDEAAAIERVAKKVDWHHPRGGRGAMAKAVRARSRHCDREAAEAGKSPPKRPGLADARQAPKNGIEAYEIENAEWFKRSLHEDEEFASTFTSYCKKYQALPTLRLYWRLDAFRHLVPKTEAFHRELQFIVAREIRATRHAFLTRGMRDVISARVEKINLSAEDKGGMDPTRIFDEARVQAFLVLHEQFRQFLRNTRGQRWLRGRVADRDGQTRRAVVPMQALARRMIALGRLVGVRERVARRGIGASIAVPRSWTRGST